MIALDKLLIDYAAGRTTVPESLIVALLGAINPEARRKIEEIEALCGCLMHNAAPAQITDACL